MFNLFTQNMFNLFRKTATKSVQISHFIKKSVQLVHTKSIQSVQKIATKSIQSI